MTVCCPGWIGFQYFVCLYMFRAYLGPSSGGTTVCIQQLVLIILFRRLSVVLVGLEPNPTRTTDSHLKRIISTSCCIHTVVEQKRNVMAHAQKPDLVFQRNGRVHLYRRGCHFSRLLAAEVFGSAVVMLDRPCPIQCTTAGYPLHSPFSPSLLHPCVSVCHHIPFLLYWPLIGHM